MKIMNFATNRMRCTALALCAFAIGSTPMWSQATQDAPPPPPAQQDGPGMGGHGHHNPEQMQARQLEHMQKHLGLTADQSAQIKTIFADTDTQMKALHENTSMAPADKHAQMKSLHEATVAKIRGVLNSEQQPKFDAMVAREHERMEHRGGPDQAPPSPPAS